MKRTISLLLIAALTVASFAFVSFAATSDGYHGYLACDVNDDGDINMKDVLLIRRYIAGAADAKALDLLAADANGDGDVNMKDVLFIRRVIAGLEEPVGNNADGKYRVGTVTIGKRNISRYSILIPEDADECMAESAKTLSKFIKNACGIKLDVISSRGDAKGYVIEYRYGGEEDALGADGYRVSVDGSVTLTCGAPRGPLYATYYFLEQFLGYRFLTSDVTYIYEADNVDTPDGFSHVDVPQFKYRAVNDDPAISSYNFAPLRLNGVEASGSRFCTNRKYGGGIGNLYMHGHSYAYQMAGWENAYNQQWVTDQGLHDKQPCLTDETTFEKIIDFNYNLYKERLGWGYEVGVNFTMIACSPNDNINFCTCTNCKAIYAEEGSIAGTVFRLSNRVAEAQRSLMPGVGVYTIAYWDARNPPKYTRPDSDVTVCFCIGGCNNHTYDHTEECAAAGGNPRLYSTLWDGTQTKSTNVDDIDAFEKWCELTDNIYIWYYSCNYGYYISPAPNVLNVYNDLKFVAKTGAAGVYFEGGGGKYSFELLRDYLACRMMWDPYMSEEEFEGYLDEFLMIYYGPGWESIKEYLFIQNRAGDLCGCWTNNFDWPWDMYDKEYYASVYPHICDLFDAAYEKALTDDERERVRDLSVHAHFLGLSATYETDSAKREYRDRYAWLLDYFNDHGYLEGVRDEGYRATSFTNSPGAMNNLPKTSSDVRDTMTWIFENYTGSRVS